MLGVIEQTAHGERIAFTNDAPADLEAPMDKGDLAEVLGPLLENAARFARRQVRVRAGGSDAACWIAVEDDGPGNAAQQESEALVRGARLASRTGAKASACRSPRTSWPHPAANWP